MCPTHGLLCDWAALGDLIDVVHAAMTEQYGDDISLFCTAFVIDLCLYSEMGAA